MGNSPFGVTPLSVNQLRHVKPQSSLPKVQSSLPKLQPSQPKAKLSQPKVPPSLPKAQLQPPPLRKFQNPTPKVHPSLPKKVTPKVPFSSNTRPSQPPQSSNGPPKNGTDSRWKFPESSSFPPVPQFTPKDRVYPSGRSKGSSFEPLSKISNDLPVPSLKINAMADRMNSPPSLRPPGSPPSLRPPGSPSPRNDHGVKMPSAVPPTFATNAPGMALPAPPDGVGGDWSHHPPPLPPAANLPSQDRGHNPPPPPPPGFSDNQSRSIGKISPRQMDHRFPPNANQNGGASSVLPGRFKATCPVVPKKSTNAPPVIPRKPPVQPTHKVPVGVKKMPPKMKGPPPFPGKFNIPRKV